MDQQQIIQAHAKRLGLSADQLTEILLFYVAGELLAWADAQEEAERGSVWYTGNVPEWIKPYVQQLQQIKADRLKQIEAKHLDMLAQGLQQ